MKIVIACDSFKGSVTSREAGEAVARGVRKALPDAEVTVISVADGGEGTIDALRLNMDIDIRECIVSDPLGRPVKARYAVWGDTAVIESAEACGLTLLTPEEYNPEKTSSYGVGQLIADALKRGSTHISVSLGGSGTNDGGVGMLQALGYSFLDVDGKEIASPTTEISKISSIDDSRVNPLLSRTIFTAICDVDNPLCGERGASIVFGPQKGADREMVLRLDRAMSHWAAVMAASTGRDYSTKAGAGAAGGLGFALMSAFGAKMISGAQFILDVVRFDEKIAGADLIITGEGRLDGQTLMGKVPFVVLQRARMRDIPTVAIGGRIDNSARSSLTQAGFISLIEISDRSLPLEISMRPDITLRNIETSIATHFKIHHITNITSAPHSLTLT